MKALGKGQRRAARAGRVLVSEVGSGGEALPGRPSEILIDHCMKKGSALAYEFSGRWLFADDIEAADLRRRNVDVKRVRLVEE